MRRVAILCALVLCVWPAGSAVAAALSIRDIQYTTSPDGSSPWDGQVVDCLGGIVTYKSMLTQPRLYLQDPACPDGWGAIMVKDWTASQDWLEKGLVNHVNVGEWVSLSNVYVEEYRGNTILQYRDYLAPDSGYAVDAGKSGQAVAPRTVGVADIAAPVEGPPGFWLVADRRAEPYEAMALTVAGVAVTAMDLGKASDNYNLGGAAGDAWATDYLNEDAPGLYHPDVFLGQQFQSVTGILEQYTKGGSTYGWDYYQLMTTASGDLAVPDPSTVVLLQAGLAVLGLGGAWRHGRGRGRGQGSTP